MDMPKRKSPRLANFNYASDNYYFVTVCTKEKECIFGQPKRLNWFGQVVERQILDIEKHFPGVSVDKYVVMPNHIDYL